MKLKLVDEQLARALLSIAAERQAKKKVRALKKLAEAADGREATP